MSGSTEPRAVLDLIRRFSPVPDETVGVFPEEFSKRPGALQAELGRLAAAPDVVINPATLKTNAQGTTHIIPHLAPSYGGEN